MKPNHDPTPHEVFVELEELCKCPYGGLEWRETARWIKYEEALELRTNRWGKPYLPYINFNAIFSLRKGLENGAVILDIEAKDMTTIALRVAEYLVMSHQIPSSQKDNVFKLLMLNRKHIKENVNMLRRASRFPSRKASVDEENLPEGLSPHAAHPRRSRSASIRKSFANILKQRGSIISTLDSSGDEQNKITVEHLETDTSVDEPPVRNIELKKKIPDDAEAMACFIGVLDFLLQPALAFVRLSQGVVMDNVIEVPIPVRFFFVLLGPYGAGIDYKEIGRAFSTLMVEKNFHEAVYAAESKSQILVAINDFLNTSIVLPPSDWKNNDIVPLDDIRSRTRENIRKVEESKAEKTKLDEDEEKQTNEKGMEIEAPPLPPPPPPRDPLVRKGILFYGVAQDIKIRYPRYLSDIVDGLNLQVLSASIFIFFAALSPAITFGSLLAEKTNRLTGVGETLLLSSVNGLIFALFAAQPIIIVGATGPLLIYDLSLLSFCNNMGIDYLGIRVWIGLWILVIGLVVGAFELVAIVKNITKFTEEIYSTLVCAIYIYEALANMIEIYKINPLIPPICEEKNDTILYGNDTYDTLDASREPTNITAEEKEPPVDQPNTALLSMCLMFGTYILAINLKSLRNKKYFGRSVRRALGDFGVPLAIFTMVIIAYFAKDVYLSRLHMPHGIQPSNSQIRGWIISPFGVVTGVPVWAMFAALPAAFLLFIFIFLEQNICLLILSKPERGLKKGTGFHLDIVLSCFINTLCGLLGAPFMSPACVRTITHMSALTIFSDKVAPGEPPQIVGCHEQRLSTLTVSVLLGLSVMLYSILNHVPNAVLLGVFLYMGVSAMAGVQFLERTFMFLLPVKYHPNVPYVKEVTTLRMHMFTLIQITMFAIAWGLKQSPASLGVPFVLLCLIPVRMYILPRIFTTQELIALDGAQNAEEASGEELDFYEHVHDLPTQIEEEDK